MQPDSQISIFEECDQSARQLHLKKIESRWIQSLSQTAPVSIFWVWWGQSFSQTAPFSVHFLSHDAYNLLSYDKYNHSASQPNYLCLYHDEYNHSARQPHFFPFFELRWVCNHALLGSKTDGTISCLFFFESQWVQSLSQTASFSLHFLSRGQSAIMHCWAVKPDGSIFCPFSESQWIRNHSSPGCAPPNRSRLELCGDQIATFPSLLPAPVMT